jgi:SAM-dependent methyltransferase
MTWNVYDRRAGTYDAMMAAFRYAPAVRDIVGSAAGRVPPGGKVLDVGCGTGFALDAVAARRRDVQLTGLDIATGMLSVCRAKRPEARLIVGDFNRPDDYRMYPTGRPARLEEDYDLIISTGAISEYGDLEVALPLLYGHMRPGGRLLAIGIGRNLVSVISGKVWHYRPNGSEAFIAACGRAGFREIAREPISWKWFPTNILKYAVSARKQAEGSRGVASNR